MKLEDLKNIDIEAVSEAIEKDAGQELPELRDSLAEAKAGQYSAIHTPEQIAIRQARKKLGMTQPRFAKMIHTKTSTLRDWEQGRFNPPGAAVALAQIAADHPDVVKRYQDVAATA